MDVTNVESTAAQENEKPLSDSQTDASQGLWIPRPNALEITSRQNTYVRVHVVAN